MKSEPVARIRWPEGKTFAFTIFDDTDSQTLAGIKKLGLGRPTSGGTIWGGRYNTLGLVFAYLKSPRRPSLIEIDLK